MKTEWHCAAVMAFAALLLHMPDKSAAQTENGNPSADAQVLQLDAVIAEALDKNPEAQAALHTIKALERRVPQAHALPDPTIAVGWAGNPAPFSTMSGDPSSYRGVTVSEQFPTFGKLKLQGQLATSDVEAAQTDYEAVRRRVTAEVKSAFYDYFYFDKAIQTTNHNKELLEKLSKIAEAQYRVGKGMQQDVLRSQVEISMLQEKLTELERQRATAQARINALMQRSPEAPLAPPAEIEPEKLQYSLQELYGMALSNDTTAQKTEKMIDRGRLSVELLQRQYRPDVGVSYMYQQRTAQQDMNGFTFTVSIPVFYRSKQRQAVAEAAEELTSAEKLREGRLNDVRFELQQQYLAAESSERLLDLYSKAIVPQSSLALESSMAGYETGKTDFLSLIANFTSLLNYETDYYRQLADYLTAIAQMETLTGVNITSPQSGIAAPAGKGI
jgi:outer membrane protein TolC